MATEKLYPAIGGTAKILYVDQRVAEAIRNQVESFPRDTDWDAVWELARVAIETDRETREVAERHARGDFTPELSEAVELARQVAGRVDGTSFQRAYDISELLDKIKGDGFDLTDVGRLLGLHSRLVEEVHKTDELVVKLQGVLLSLKG